MRASCASTAPSVPFPVTTAPAAAPGDHGVAGPVTTGAVSGIGPAALTRSLLLALLLPARRLVPRLLFLLPLLSLLLVLALPPRISVRVVTKGGRYLHLLVPLLPVRLDALFVRVPVFALWALRLQFTSPNERSLHDFLPLRQCSYLVTMFPSETLLAEVFQVSARSLLRAESV